MGRPHPSPATPCNPQDQAFKDSVLGSALVNPYTGGEGGDGRGGGWAPDAMGSSMKVRV